MNKYQLWVERTDDRGKSTWALEGTSDWVVDMLQKEALLRDDAEVKTILVTSLIDGWQGGKRLGRG